MSVDKKLYAEYYDSNLEIQPIEATKCDLSSKPSVVALSSYAIPNVRKTYRYPQKHLALDAREDTGVRTYTIIWE